MYVRFDLLFFGVADSKKEADKFSRDWLNREEPTSKEDEVYAVDDELENGATVCNPAPPGCKGNLMF